MPVLAWAWLAAGLLSSVIGLFQYLGVADHFSLWMTQTEAGMAFANLRQRNQFATLTNVSLAAVLWFVGTGHFSGRSHWLMLAATGVLAAGNAASLSRTGLLQLGLLCALFGIWGGLRHAAVRRVLLVALGIYGLAILALPLLAGFDLSTHGMFVRLQAGDQACASRLTLWSNVLQLIAQKPWFGWGWGELDYAHYTTFYPGFRFCDILDNAHNLPLHLAVELGVPFALLVCGMVGWFVLRARPWHETHPSRQMAWAVLAVIGLHSLLEYPLWYGPFQMAVGLCVLVLWRGNNAASGQQFKGNRALAHIHQALTATFLIAIVGYAVWDYHRVSQIYLAPQARDAAYREDTLAKIRNSWLFPHQVSFAELSITPLTQANAQWTFDIAQVLLHYSPEPRVIEKVIESAVMLGRDDEALLHLARYRAAFPQAHAKWRDVKGLRDGPAD